MGTTIGDAGVRSSKNTQFNNDGTLNSNSEYASLLTNTGINIDIDGDGANTDTTTLANIGRFIMTGTPSNPITAAAKADDKDALTKYLSAQLDDALAENPDGKKDDRIARIIAVANKAGVTHDVLIAMQKDLMAASDISTADTNNNKALKFIANKLTDDAATKTSEDPKTRKLIDALNASSAAPIYNISGGLKNDIMPQDLKNLTGDSADKAVAGLASTAENLIAELARQPNSAEALQKMKNFLSMANALGDGMQQALARALAKDGMLEEFKKAVEIATSEVNKTNAGLRGNSENTDLPKGFFQKIDEAHTALDSGKDASTALTALFGDDKTAKGQFMGDWIDHSSNQSENYQKAVLVANIVDDSTSGDCHVALNNATTSRADQVNNSSTDSTTQTTTVKSIEDCSDNAKKLVQALQTPSDYDTGYKRSALIDKLKTLPFDEQQVVAHELANAAIKQSDNAKNLANLKLFADGALAGLGGPYNQNAWAFYQSLYGQFAQRSASASDNEKQKIANACTVFQSYKISDLSPFSSAMGDGLTNLINLCGGTGSPTPIKLTGQTTGTSGVAAANDGQGSSDVLPSTVAWAKARGIKSAVKITLDDDQYGDKITYSGVDAAGSTITNTFIVDSGTFSDAQVNAIRARNQDSSPILSANFLLPSGSVITLDFSQISS